MDGMSLIIAAAALAVAGFLIYTVIAFGKVKNDLNEKCIEKRSRYEDSMNADGALREQKSVEIIYKLLLFILIKPHISVSRSLSKSAAKASYGGLLLIGIDDKIVLIDIRKPGPVGQSIDSIFHIGISEFKHG